MTGAVLYNDNRRGCTGVVDSPAMVRLGLLVGSTVALSCIFSTAVAQCVSGCPTCPSHTARECTVSGRQCAVTCTPNRGYACADESCSHTITTDAKCHQLVGSHSSGSTSGSSLICTCDSGYGMHPIGCSMDAGTCTFHRSPGSRQ